MGCGRRGGERKEKGCGKYILFDRFQLVKLHSVHSKQNKYHNLHKYTYYSVNIDMF